MYTKSAGWMGEESDVLEFAEEVADGQIFTIEYPIMIILGACIIRDTRQTRSHGRPFSVAAR